ncbi:hypothetical protein ACJIZ3_002570 [Penstemon smallii]|uniref:Remorin C-terminal domain-containing protein n=1 Tax=Penstemon smallii TaxID=265156 RepID=A0ABD3UA34_9LAMI
MAELGFQGLRSGFRARDFSPDSVIFPTESNFSIFSSASGSVERCSFASDVPDQDSFASEPSQHELTQVLSGPDPDPNKSKLIHNKSVNIIRKDKAKVHKLDSSEAETTEDENIAVDSARNSFSQALKECQDRRLRTKALLKKENRRRPASLDLNNSFTNSANSYSPRFGIMNKPSSNATQRTTAFPSPGTPNQKGWSSERIPLHKNAYRKNVNTSLFLYNSNGKTLPSKWEDAERWIFSPVSIQQPQRKPKSKSGPLGPPGVAYCQLFEGEVNNEKVLMAPSPFSASGVMATDGLPCMGRSISIHGCSETMCQSSHQDEKYDHGTENGANNLSRDVSRRDMATQMSPESSRSIHSSPRTQSSFSLPTPPSILQILESKNMISFDKQETRDVPIDERVTVTRWSKKNKGKTQGGRGSTANVENDWKRKAVSIQSSSWEVSTDTSKSISKIQREEANITAWENLQKAKAEAAIRKLEMKLEKKRSSSMDKIMNKLRSAQKKAQEKRSSALGNPTHHIVRSSEKALSFRRTTRPISSLSGCFTCHAF